jgi:thioredoxin 1
MNKKVLSYALAAALMLPVSVASAKAMPQVQQTKVAEAEKGTQFFKGTFAEALAKAKKENKTLIVDCYTLWCGPCRYMKTNVFPDENLGKYLNEKFVLMQLDMEHGEGPERNKTFQVKAYPTFIYFNGDGKEISRFEGMCMQDEFKNRCERILKGEAPISEESRKEEAARMKKQMEAKKDSIIDEGKGVNFLKGSEVRLTDVLAKAKQENKRVLVDFWATWCHACVQMNKTTFRDTRIGKLMNYAFVNYAIDVDHDADAKELQDKFDIKAYPTYLILNPDGTEYNRIIGSKTVGEFGTAVAKALMGEEDEFVKMDRLQSEAMAQAKAERQSKLTATSKATPKTKVKFLAGTDVEKGIKTAKAKKKNLMVFISDSDYKSDYVEKYVFNDDATADYLNKNFVCMFLDANSKQGDAAMTKYELEESFPGFMLFNSKGEFKGCAEGTLRSAKIMQETFDMYLNYVPKK